MTPAPEVLEVTAGALIAELVASASGHARDMRLAATNPAITPLRQMFAVQLRADGTSRLVERRWAS